VAAVLNGQIYTSTDSGVTWTPRESSRGWQSVASSADGTKLVAVEEAGQNGGRIYTSTDSGVSWTPRESNRIWTSVASSADGFKLVAVVGSNETYPAGGQIYTSEPPSVSGAAGTAQQFQYNGNGEWQPVGVDDTALSANVALLNRSPQTFTGENDFSSSTQFSERLRLSGQEFYQPGNTDTEGLSLLLGVNRSDNRQLWIADSGRLAVNNSNPVLRMLVNDKAQIDSVATDGTTPLPLSLGPNGSLALAANGHVGIGTTSPTKGALQVDLTDGVSPDYSQAGWLTPDGTLVAGVGPGVPVSIWAKGWIMAQTFIAFSDARIKNIQGPSDGAADLQTLLGIQITDYTYKDTIANGTRPQKKVIAQQVEKVYPQAVSQSTGEVPDIYQRAPVKDGWVQLATDLKVGERVKLIGEKEQGVYPVLEVRDGAFRTGFQPKGDKVFVYGRQVDDFRTVDYEAIAMLNVSATQEIYRELSALKAENAELKKKVGRIDELAQKNAAMESRLVALEKLITHQHLALNGGAK